MAGEPPPVDLSPAAPVDLSPGEPPPVDLSPGEAAASVRHITCDD
jgi:hypothetical protein